MRAKISNTMRNIFHNTAKLSLLLSYYFLSLNEIQFDFQVFFFNMSGAIKYYTTS